MSTTEHVAEAHSAPTGQQFIDMQRSDQFQDLRTTLRRFVFPMTAFFLIWYGLYVALGAFAHDFMATPVWGNINVGLILGLLQFVSTFVITGAYVRFANRELDPRAAALREEMDTECAATGQGADATQSSNATQGTDEGATR